MAYDGYRPMTQYGEVNTSLGSGRGVVFWVVAVPSSGDWELRLRDGSDTEGETIMRIIDEIETGKLFRFDPPLPFETGLFVDMVDDMLGFIVAYDFLPR